VHKSRKCICGCIVRRKNMSEVTRIITVKVTAIGRKEDFVSKEETKKRALVAVKELFDCDDVVVTDVQDFVMEE
jgi:hypothetical protein